MSSSPATQSFGNISAGSSVTNVSIGVSDDMFDFKAAIETSAPSAAGAGTSTAGTWFQDTEKAVGGMFSCTDAFDFKAMGESEAAGTQLASVTDLIIDPFNGIV